jgi:hypothetical protein
MLKQFAGAVMAGLVALVIASPTMAQWNPPSVVPQYVWAGGVLAAQNYKFFDGNVPADKTMTFNRNDLWPMTMEPGATAAVMSTNADVTGGANFYASISYGVNHTTATMVGDYRRTHCEDTVTTGFCIAHKTAVRNLSGGLWGMWLYQDQIGPGVMAARYISADNPAGHGDTSYAVPFIDIVASDLDITQSVVRWNVSDLSTGDYLQLHHNNVGVVMRIDHDGVVYAPNVVIGGVPLDQYIRNVVAATVTAQMKRAATSR